MHPRLLLKHAHPTTAVFQNTYMYTRLKVEVEMAQFDS